MKSIGILIGSMTVTICSVVSALNAAESGKPTLKTVDLTCDLGLCSPVMVLSNSTDQRITIKVFDLPRAQSTNSRPKIIDVESLRHTCSPLYLVQTHSDLGWTELATRRSADGLVYRVLGPSEYVFFSVPLETNVPYRVGLRYWSGLKTNVLWGELNSPFSPGDPSDYSKMTIEQLVNELTHIDAQTPGIHGTATVRAFIAEDKPPEFAGGIIGSTTPKNFPQMRELVRRGLIALPSLIKHLDDKRPTQLTVGGSSFMFWYISDEYDPRTRSNTDRATGLKKDFDGKYTVKVGDVCYAIIGQIVNRNLLPVRYQPTGGLIINSPVEVPSLVGQVRKDWDTLDAKSHMESLLSDARAEPHIWFYGPALQRLRFYYPEEYERQKIGALKDIISEFEAAEKKPVQ